MLDNNENIKSKLTDLDKAENSPQNPTAKEKDFSISVDQNVPAKGENSSVTMGENQTAKEENSSSVGENQTAKEENSSSVGERLYCFRFSHHPVLQWFNSSLDLKKGDKVIVQTQRGREISTVISCEGKDSAPVNEGNFIANIERIATQGDLENDKSNREKEIKAAEICKEKINEHNLPMKLIRVHYLFDGGKILFFFRSAGKVDFRALVKELAGIFRTRIELRQVGVRDESGMLGGLGICGEQICCSRFLPGFDSISIRMAKDQQLSLNPTKISGQCGRLMCCLKYEINHYVEQGEKLPSPGSILEIENEAGKVSSCNLISETIFVEFENFKRITLKSHELEEGIRNNSIRVIKAKGKWKNRLKELLGDNLKDSVDDDEGDDEIVDESVIIEDSRENKTDSVTGISASDSADNKEKEAPVQEGMAEEKKEFGKKRDFSSKADRQKWKNPKNPNKNQGPFAKENQKNPLGHRAKATDNSINPAPQREQFNKGDNPRHFSPKNPKKPTNFQQRNDRKRHGKKDI